MARGYSTCRGRAAGICQTSFWINLMVIGAQLGIRYGISFSLGSERNVRISAFTIVIIRVS